MIKEVIIRKMRRRRHGDHARNGAIVPFFPDGAAPNGISLPVLFSPDPPAARRFLEFFTANLRNPHTRKAYAKAAGEFAAWCGRAGIGHLREVLPVHVAAYVEELQRRLS